MSVDVTPGTVIVAPGGVQAVPGTNETIPSSILPAPILEFKGGYDAATNTPDLDVSPTGVSQGDAYAVTADGLFFTEQARVGDLIIAEQDNPTTLGHWARVERNVDLATESVAGIVQLAADGDTAPGEAVQGSDSRLAAAVVAVARALFDANTLLKADADDTPTPLTVPEQRFIGRITGGVIEALTAAQARTLLNVEDGATADLTGPEIKALYEAQTAFVFNGSVRSKWVAVTGPDAVVAEPGVSYFADCTAGAVTLNAWAGLTDGDSISVVKAGSNNLTLPDGTVVTATDTTVITVSRENGAWVPRGHLGSAADLTNAGGLLASNNLSDVGTVATAQQNLDLEPGVDVQGYDATLAALAGLATVADRLIYATGADTFSLATLTAFARTLLDDADAATARATLGAQPLDATLTALAALSTAGGKLIKATGSDAFTTIDVSAFIETLLDDPNAATARATLGVGSATTSVEGIVELATDGEGLAGKVVQGNDARLAGNLKGGAPGGVSGTARNDSAATETVIASQTIPTTDVGAHSRYDGLYVAEAVIDAAGGANALTLRWRLKDGTGPILYEYTFTPAAGVTYKIAADVDLIAPSAFNGEKVTGRIVIENAGVAVESDVLNITPGTGASDLVVVMTAQWAAADGDGDVVTATGAHLHRIA